MGRAVVTVHAIHRPVFAGVQLLRGRLQLRGRVDHLSAVVREVAHPRDDLAATVRRDVVDPLDVVEVPPVDSDSSTAPASSDLHQ